MTKKEMKEAERLEAKEKKDAAKQEAKEKKALEKQEAKERKKQRKPPAPSDRHVDVDVEMVGAGVGEVQAQQWSQQSLPLAPQSPPLQR